MNKKSKILKIKNPKRIILMSFLFLVCFVLAFNYPYMLVKNNDLLKSPTTTPSPEVIVTLTPTITTPTKVVSKKIIQSPTPKVYPNLDDKLLFEGINKVRLESGIANPFIHDNGTCYLVDKMIEFYDSNGRLPWVPDLKYIEDHYSRYLNPKFAMIDKQVSVQGAVSTLASGDYKWLLTSGQFKWACIKSKAGAVALVVVFD